MDFNATENQFAVLAESLPQLVWSARADGSHDYFNRRWHEFTGLTPEQCLGDGWQVAVHPKDLPEIQAQWRRSVETGVPYECEYRIRNASGRYEWMLSRAVPIQDLSGDTVRWFGTSTNIDAQKKAEEAVRNLETRYRLALEAADLGTWQIDFEKNVVLWDEGTSILHHLPHQEAHTRSLDEAIQMVHPDDRENVRIRIEKACDPRSDGHYECEYRALMPDGRIHWFRSVGQASFAPDGEGAQAVSLSGVLSDVTERHTFEEAQLLLTRELNHRVKNLFAIANGMVSMTARTAKDPKEMATALRGRLSALSRAHELVQPAAAMGHGAGPDVDLARLCEAVLEPYRQVGTDRVGIEGPSVHVGSNTTTSLALVLHELATNAAKYGCLSSPEGRLSIRWTIHDEAVDLMWAESGGPVIETPPNFQGFGTQLSQRSIAGQLGGTLEQEWLPEGLRVHMILPLSRLTG
ncbi:PAS domain-containing protein [Microvirga sp. ACRRW]|uniref:sensor histidine kinase n=1 Tax=Microvirga sp. ACRRW TaxID=2918205 RepID=UPI001EF581F7|nr:PAS domain-containing protein [Microvirga sp. ACRRW]